MIIFFEDKKKEIEKRIEEELTAEELHLDYYRNEIKRIRCKLAVTFLGTRIALGMVVLFSIWQVNKYETGICRIANVLLISILLICGSVLLQRKMEKYYTLDCL